MDYADIKNRIEVLRRELDEIAEQNRQQYKKKRSRTKKKQQEVQDRVRQIRNELYALLERTRAA